MTQAIIDDQEKEKEVYEFLEEDDDFEEFEPDFNAQSHGADVEMRGEVSAADKKLWQQDWDDEEVDEDFGKQLRAQLSR